MIICGIPLLIDDACGDSPPPPGDPRLGADRSSAGEVREQKRTVWFLRPAIGGRSVGRWRRKRTEENRTEQNRTEHRRQRSRRKSSQNRTRKLRNEVPGASGLSFLRCQGDVLRSPVPCCMRWALRATSGGAPEVSRGRSRGARGALGDLSDASGDGPGPSLRSFFDSRSRPGSFFENRAPV